MQIMKISSLFKNGLLKFFILVFALAIPFWLLGAMAKQGLPVPMNLPISALMFPVPLVAALIMVYSEEGLRGLRGLFKRIIDYKKIRPKWYLPIILLTPIIFFSSYLVIRLLGLPLPTQIYIPLLTIPILFIVFFISAAGEEAGWMGYAIDPMLSRWSALKASIILGLIWAIWHFIPFIQTGNTLSWVAWQSFYTVMLRVLIVWAYNNTGKSVLSAVLFHDMSNVSWSLFPNNGSNYDPAITGIITAITVVIVAFLWGTKTLARFRYSSAD